MPAYDTVVIKSPPIDSETKEMLLNFCCSYESVEIGTGVIKYCFTSGELKGSYDYRIRMNVDNREWVKPEGEKTPICIETDYYVRLECSVHKLMNIHNCFGGPNDIKKSLSYLVDFVNKAANVNLPEYLKWEVIRVDVANIYEFNDSKICQKVLERLKNNVYSRRKALPYENGVMWSGSTSTCKFYWKGAEFKDHDYKRLTKYLSKQIDYSASEDYGDLKRQKLLNLKENIDNVLKRALRIIRFEVEVKPRTLQKLFNSKTVLVEMLDDNKLFDCMNAELRKCVKENDEMGVIRRSDLVRDTLNDKYGSSLANCLYSVWAKMVQFGENSVRSEMSKATFYRYKKQLLEAGVSWSCCNVNLNNLSIVPNDFTFLNSKYVCEEVSSVVSEKLGMIA